MRTIPTKWKAGSTNRDLWYNVTGSPVILVLIRSEQGTLRLTNKDQVLVHESTSIGYVKYDGRFFVALSEISQRLNYLQGEAGGSGVMGEATITLNAGEVDGYKLVDLVDLWGLTNALVDIWFCPWEARSTGPDRIDVVAGDPLLAYSGILSSIDINPAQITLRVNERAIIYQQTIPRSLQEHNDLLSLAYHMEEEDKAQPVPMTFGTGYWKVLQADVSDYAARKIETIVGFPRNWIGGPGGGYPVIAGLHYWNGKNYVEILKYTKADWWNYNTQKTVWISTSTTGGVILRVNDLAYLPKVIGNYLVIAPEQVDNIHADAHNGAAMCDGSVDGEHEDRLVREPQDAPYILFNNLTFGAGYVSIWKAYFDKKAFPACHFAVFPLADLLWGPTDVPGSEAPYVRFRFWPSYISSWNAPIIHEDENSWNPYMDRLGNPLFQGTLLWCARDIQRPEWLAPLPWSDIEIPSLHNVGVFCLGATPGYFTNLGNLSDIPAAGLEVCIQLDRFTGTAYTRSIQVHEFGLLVVPFRLQNNIYAYGNMGHDNFRNMTMDLLQYIGVPYISAPVWNWAIYDNFLNSLKLDTQISEFMGSQDLIDRLAREFGVWSFVDEDGYQHFVEITPKAVDYTVGDSDMKKGASEPWDISVGLMDTEIYSRFEVAFQKNTANGAYEMLRYVNPDYNNLTTISPTSLAALCAIAEDDYGSKKKLHVDLPDVRDINTAEIILGKLVQLYSNKKHIVKFTSSLRLMDLRLGDQVRFLTTFYTSEYNFFIVGKTINHLANTITFECVEAPWTSGPIECEFLESEMIHEACEYHKI
jgi:hypothetical protein